MQQLTLADEIVVLMLRDDTGTIKPACSGYANIAIAGGVLMELALLGRIDTDLNSLFIVDAKPTGDELLDQALKEIFAEPNKSPTTWWIERFGLSGGDLTRTVLSTPGRGRHSSRGRSAISLVALAPRLSAEHRA